MISFDFIKQHTFKYQIPYLSASFQISDNKLKNSLSPPQLYLRPDMRPALIELVKLNEWKEIYFIYNHEKGFMNNWFLK